MGHPVILNCIGATSAVKMITLHAVIFTILIEITIKIIPGDPEAPIFISTKSNNSRSFFLRSRLA